MDDNQIEMQQTGLWQKANTVTVLSKYLALALFVLLPFAGFWFGLQQVPVPVINPVPVVDTTTENIQNKSKDDIDTVKQANHGVEYRNNDYGFSLVLPDTLTTVGFLIEDALSGKGMGGRQVDIYAKGVDPVTGEMSLHAVSNIGVYPISEYTPVTCEDPDGLCFPGVELGRNNKYVFVSEYFSPESYGACYDNKVGEPRQLTGLFYENNTTLCSDTTIQYPEKTEGAFEIFEVK